MNWVFQCYQVVQVFYVFWVLRYLFKECQISVEGFLEDGLFVGGDVLVFGFGEKVGYGLGIWVGNIEVIEIVSFCCFGVVEREIDSW